METITTPPTGVIVKSDCTGRTRYTSQSKAGALAAYQRSSLSAPAFLVAEVATIAECQGGALEVHFPGGTIARAADAGQIRLLATLFRQSNYVKVDEPSGER